jgi:ribosome-associated protein
MPLEINARVAIPDDAFELKFIRSGGPGGQNVNKVATAVQLRVYLDRCGLRPEVRTRLEGLAGRRLTDSGEVVIAAQQFRTQERNREDAFERFAEMVRQALVAPIPRRATKPTRSAKRKRVDTKTKRGAMKKLRGKVGDEGG